MFQLAIHTRNGETAHLLERQHLTLGSDPECDIVIASPFVAPLAARLDWEEGRGFRLVAAPEERSVSVNGLPVISALLEDGDEIRSGDFVGTLRSLPDAPLAPARQEKMPQPVHFSPASAGGTNLEALVLQQSEELNQLRPLRAALEDSQRRLEETVTALAESRRECESRFQDLAAERHQAAALSAQFARERQDAARQIEELQDRLLELEARTQEMEQDFLRRVERAQETVANLRKAVAQQDGELREQRQNLLKLQQAKNAAETQLECIRKTYCRDRKQHGRLVDQFRERARREMARADMALDELARSRQSSPDQS